MLEDFHKEIDDMSELQAKALLVEIRQEVRDECLKPLNDCLTLAKTGTFWAAIYDVFERAKE